MNLLFLALIGLLLTLVAIAVLALCCIKLKKELTVKKMELLEAQQLVESRDKFFSIVAHDLKSPFNSLMGLSELLMLHAESMNAEQVQHHCMQIFNSSGRLFTLVDDLLQWSRVQTGKIQYNPEKIDLNVISSNIVNLLRISVQEKDIVIALNLENNLIAYADSNIYSTVLRNLISNAIKFSRVGSTIYVKGHKNKDGMIEISVTDRGIGMDKKQLDNLFIAENKQSTTGTFNEQGTGLGLVLCKEFVELNKGEIIAESEPDEGTTIRFTVPSEIE
jgi:two-component system sensor histidine kinase/response regulator